MGSVSFGLNCGMPAGSASVGHITTQDSESLMIISKFQGKLFPEKKWLCHSAAMPPQAAGRMPNAVAFSRD